MTEAIATVIVLEVFSARRNDAAFLAKMTRFVRMNVVTVAAANNPDTFAEKPDPKSPEEFGSWLAECGFPLSAIRDAYWIGMRQLIDQWAKRYWVDLIPHGTRDEKSLSDHVWAFTSAVFDFTESGARRAEGAYEQMRADLYSRGVLYRRDLVTDVLTGNPCGRVADIETALGYRISGTHIGVLVDAPDHVGASEALRAAKLASRAAAFLVVMLDTPQLAAWFNYAQIGSETVALLHKELRQTDLRISVGRPHRGLPGFIRTHRQAKHVEELRNALDESKLFLYYEEFALEAMFLRDLPAAAAFAIDELGELAEHSPRARTIRQTLLAWLSSGSRTATASELGVHENTVRQRLNFAAEVLGPDFVSRRSELLVALRVCRAVGTESLALKAAGAH
ncbi:PucR family transcriptional regulator [Streptomyces sp. NPDC058683]|uniref:PucR family transcriptional regulator n=1 Tax=Streptomyces sp. NPDC058683 TaxID=3346597 RepID=UPI00365D029B